MTCEGKGKGTGTGKGQLAETAFRASSAACSLPTCGSGGYRTERSMIGPWRRIDPALSARLARARRELAWAAQLPAAAAARRVSRREDGASASLGWDGRHEALVSRPFGDVGVRVGLRPADLALLVIDRDGGVVIAQPLAGRTYLEAARLLAGVLAALGEDPAVDAPRPLVLPPHPVAEGHAFVGDGAGQAALADWLSNAHGTLARVAIREGGEPPRCWPRPAALRRDRALDRGPLETRTPIAIGSRTLELAISLGDARVDMPYARVSPRPLPSSVALAPLTVGGWRTEGGLDAVLLGRELPSAEGQEETMQLFFDEALRACRRLDVDGAPAVSFSPARGSAPE